VRPPNYLLLVALATGQNAECGMLQLSLLSRLVVARL
jgi:hypothetical protein